MGHSAERLKRHRSRIGAPPSMLNPSWPYPFVSLALHTASRAANAMHACCGQMPRRPCPHRASHPRIRAQPPRRTRIPRKRDQRPCASHRHRRARAGTPRMTTDNSRRCLPCVRAMPDASRETSTWRAQPHPQPPWHRKRVAHSQERPTRCANCRKAARRAARSPRRFVNMPAPKRSARSHRTPARHVGITVPCPMLHLGTPAEVYPFSG